MCAMGSLDEPELGIVKHRIGCSEYVSGNGTTDLLCSITTSSAHAPSEQPESRAYKLGKKKCSYNQVELIIRDVVAARSTTELKVSEAIETSVGSEVDDRLRESCLKFNVRFSNGIRMHLYVFIVYGTPHSMPRSNNSSSNSSSNSKQYQWVPVTRSKCLKGCNGPVIRGLQRFGRMSKRALDGEEKWKETKHLYIAIDEASTHVCPKAVHEGSKFRLLAAGYDDKYKLVGTTVSSTIRVLANNDAPLGAAFLRLHCNIKGGWGRAEPTLQLQPGKFRRSKPLRDISNRPRTRDTDTMVLRTRKTVKSFEKEPSNYCKPQKVSDLELHTVKKKINRPAEGLQQLIIACNHVAAADENSNSDDLTNGKQKQGSLQLKDSEAEEARQNQTEKQPAQPESDNPETETDCTNEDAEHCTEGFETALVQPEVLAQPALALTEREVQRPEVVKFEVRQVARPEATRLYDVRTMGFDPLQYLTPEQIQFFRLQNPEFLFNLVRYSREMYHMMQRDSGSVMRPVTKRIRTDNLLPFSQ